MCMDMPDIVRPGVAVRFLVLFRHPAMARLILAEGLLEHAHSLLA